jgi:hypothetical protein
VKSSQTGRVVGYSDGGVIVELTGDTIAVVELAIRAGYPNDYVPQTRDPGMWGEPIARTVVLPMAPVERPTSTGRWSSRPILEILQGPARL